MSYLIIILIIAVALAPLSHFVPSKAQRKVARLREYAALNRFFVEFRDLPNQKIKARGGALAHTIYYGRRIRPALDGPPQRLCWLFEQGRWTGSPIKVAVPEAVLTLPDGVLAASADSESCGIYWLETGDEAEIDQIGVVLDALIEKLYK
ncbi:MAG: hypothetical protein V7746_05655 [Halioglobus sp.]